MDAIIRQTVREEMRRSASLVSERVASTEVESSDSATTGPTFSSRTVNRLSGLLNRIRNHGSTSSNKKRKIVKEHRIQVRWCHYDERKKEFITVRQKNGGGNRFITYTDEEPIKLETLTEKARTLFFPDGKNNFAGRIQEMNTWICNASGVAIFDFPDEGTVDDYLKKNGLYPSSTYFFLRTQPRHLLADEFESSEAIGAESLSASEEAPSVASSTQVCKVCCCSFKNGETCLRCEQNDEYQQSLLADCAKTAPAEELDLEDDELEGENIASLVSLDHMRELRVAHFQAVIGRETVQNSVGTSALLCEAGNSSTNNTVVSEPELSGQETFMRSSDFHDEGNSCPGPSRVREDHGVMSVTVHRSLICSDMIEHFKDTRVMNSSLLFTIINERGHKEEGVGVGVEREVYSLFWKQFANSMTIGERERVPFIRHDHFIKEWEAVGRILVKGYQSVSYFPLFLSKAFICYCLFGAEVPESILLESFMKYLSPVEEDLVKEYLEKDCLPDDNDELLEFLERFNCRSAVSSENLRKLLIEIANQELIQKPHVMISTWQPSVQELKQYPQFQSTSGIQGLYDTLKPTTKKVLQILAAQPNTEAERDAFKFLQRYVRGLDNTKLIQFLRFTTASDILTTTKLEVAFTKLEGVGCRPIAHTCGPVLELPSTYSNFVEVREQFNNILDKDTWEMDIM
ncbi:uncharacterized protein [Acropora muricata]|uniref:uncharacterized protein n=2 Tax=Acropora muricata TaxID=159855 RepID=UPI0034E39C0A